MMRQKINGLTQNRKLSEKQMKTNGSFKFHNLAPSLINKDAPSYKICETALNQAYENEEIKNIAITGIHGSGKSSFLKTYYSCNKKRSRSMIKVAIADFSEVPNETDSNGDLVGDKISESNKKPEKIEIAERQIINQILYQIPSRKIPLSKFLIKDRRGWWKSLLLTVIFMMFIIGVFSLFNDSLLMFICSEILEIVETDYWIKLIDISCLIIPMTLATWWLARRINFRLNKISFKGAESELTENDDTELLDQEAREIVYLILASEIETIIFEDLDRFNDISIFVRLREINSLVNSRSKKTVRFIYVVRDGLFEFKDRTKFFDLIIPIIPYITSHNSRGKILEIFGDIEKINYKIDPIFLEQISLFIDDMRVLYAIRNEYEIYTKSINTDVYANELFAMIVLKNVFPKEFEDLERDRGYLYRILNKRKTLLNEYANEIQSKHSELRDIKTLIDKKRIDIIISYIPKNVEFEGLGDDLLIDFLFNWFNNPDTKKTINIGGSRDRYDYRGFIRTLIEMKPGFEKELHKLEEEKRERENRLHKTIKEMENLYEKIKIYKTKELLMQKDEEGLNEYFEEKEYPTISNQHYFPLIRYLILTGLIDENYWRYKGFFHEGNLGKNDNIYINRVLSGKEIDNYFRLDNPSVVIQYLLNEDYSRKDIVNYDLVDYLLNHKDSNKLARVADVILSTMDIGAINYLNNYDYEKLKAFTFSLVENSFWKFWKFCENPIIPDDLKLKLAGIACQEDKWYSTPEFRQFVAEHSEILELDFILEKESMLSGIEIIGIQFIDVSTVKISSKTAHFLIHNNLFVLSVSNILNIVSLYLKKTAENVLTELYKFIYLEVELQPLKIEIIKNLDKNLKEYIIRINSDNIKSKSGEEVFIEILNSEIALETKKGFIEIESSMIGDLSKVEFNKLLDNLLEQSLVIYNEKNVENYYERIGTKQAVIALLNDNYDYEFPLPKSMCRDLVNAPETNIKLFNLVMDDIEEKIDLLHPSLGNEKYSRLIEKKLIDLNVNNFEILLKTVKDSLITDFLATFPKELFAFLIENNLVMSLPLGTLYEVLDKKVLSDTESYNLIVNYGKKLSLYKIPNASMNIRKRVLQNWFDVTDYQRIVDNPEFFDLWDDFITIMNNNSDKWEIVLNQNTNFNFIDKAIKDDNLVISHKIELLINVITKKEFVDNWQKWLESFEETRNIATVFNIRKPLIENEYEERVSVVLEEIGIATKGRDNRLHFKPKRYKKIRRQ